MKPPQTRREWFEDELHKRFFKNHTGHMTADDFQNMCKKVEGWREGCISAIEDGKIDSKKKEIALAWKENLHDAILTDILRNLLNMMLEAERVPTERKGFMERVFRGGDKDHNQKTPHALRALEGTSPAVKLLASLPREDPNGHLSMEYLLALHDASSRYTNKEKK